jgi:hypothetical protein
MYTSMYLLQFLLSLCNVLSGSWDDNFLGDCYGRYPL